LNPFIKGKVDKIVIAGIILVILFVCLVISPFYLKERETNREQAFAKEKLNLELLQLRISSIKTVLHDTAETLVEGLEKQSKEFSPLADSTSSTVGLNESDFGEFQLKRYSLLSTATNKQTNIPAKDDLHYVLAESSPFLSTFNVLSKNDSIEAMYVVADMGEYTYQVLQNQNRTFSISLLEWLSLNKSKFSGSGSISNMVITPPLANRNTLENFVLVSLPVTNQKPVYLIIELDLSELSLEVGRSTKYVLWQKENARVVSSNIEIGAETTSNVQSFLLSKYIPKPWHDILFAGEATDSIYTSIDKNEYVIKVAHVYNSDYLAFFYKNTQSMQAALWQTVMIEGFKIIAVGVVGLAILYLLVYYLFAKPISNFLNFVEQQNSLYERDSTKKPKGWEPWFEKIAVSYDDNRKLFNSLVAKNKQLDDKIRRRTHELQLQTISKDRNLALNRAIINSIPDMIYYKNIDGSFVGCNKSFESLCGINEDQLVTRTVEDVFEERLAQELSNFDFQALRSKRLFSAKVWQKVGDEDVFINWLVAPISNSEGEVLGTVGLGRDITEQDANLRQIEQARYDAEQANLAKSEFIANMSHEIRTPMNAIIGMLELLNNTAPTALQSTYLGVAESSSRHLLQVINDILDFSKMNAGMLELTYEEVNLNDVLDISFANSLATAMEKDLILDIQLPPKFPELFNTDKIRLSQIFTNLINNAVKFTKEGQVLFKAKVLAENNDDVMVMFTVTDTGIGIPKDRQRIIFDAFSQADTSITRQYGGTGLGLAIVFQLVELMNGEIRVESTEGSGTSFHVVLPLQKIAEQAKVHSSDKRWVVFATNPMLEQFLLNKLITFNQDAKVLNRELPSSMLIEENTVLICQPALVELLPSDWKEAIKSGEIEYQPIIFNLSNFTKTMLGDLPYRPILSMPFSTSALVTNFHEVSNDEKHQNFCQGAHILIVEDNIVNQQVTALILDSLGATYDIADNGLEGLRKVNKNQFDAVLVDIQMPVMDGLTFAKKVRAQNRFETLPLIAMTAHTRPEDQQRSIEAGMSLHINKPIERTRLVNALMTYVTFDTKEPIQGAKGLQEVQASLPAKVLDTENLLKQVGGNFGLMLKLLTLFKDSKLAELKSISTEVNEMESVLLFSKFHNVEGMLANIRASASVIAIQQLRAAVKAEEEEMIRQSVINWDNAIKRLEKEICSMVSQ